MNPDDGRIYIHDEGDRLPERFVPMVVPPTPKQVRRKKVGRNDPCPCGSGKKFKKCHMTVGRKSP